MIDFIVTTVDRILYISMIFSPGCDFDCSFKTCCCAGLGCCRQKLSGTDGSIAFLAAGGTLIYRQLKADETIIVDSRSIVAFEHSVELGIVSNGRFCTCCFGGEGCFSSTLKGKEKEDFICFHGVGQLPLYSHC